MGIANAAAAFDEGARILDGSLGGLGGCPFAPGATGNVVFEDLVFLCESKGFATGIDMEKLIAVRSILKSEMPDEALYGGVARAGLPCGMRTRREVFSLLPVSPLSRRATLSHKGRGKICRAAGPGYSCLCPCFRAFAGFPSPVGIITTRP